MLNTSEYRNGIVVLYNCENQDIVNMILYNGYTFNAIFNTLYHFQINCDVSSGPIASFTYEPMNLTIQDTIQFNDTSTAFGGSISIGHGISVMAMFLTLEIQRINIQTMGSTTYPLQ